MNIDLVIGLENISKETIEDFITLSGGSLCDNSGKIISGPFVGRILPNNRFKQIDDLDDDCDKIIIGNIGGENIRAHYEKRDQRWVRTILSVADKHLVEDDNVLDIIYNGSWELEDGQVLHIAGNEILVKVIPDENGYEEYFFW